MYSIKHMHLLITSALVVIFLIGCVSTPSTPVSTATASLPESELRLETYFQDFTGAFVLYDLNNDHYIRYNPERCSKRFLPASTFKIMNSLIALETGVVPDEDHVIKWDGTEYPIPEWNQDHSLRTAMKYSVVWYHEELARRTGREKMRYYLDTVGYGNTDSSGPEVAFWLTGALRISADEQLEFLKRLYRNDLPFSERSMDIVKEIMLLEKTDDYQLSGKTGSGQLDGTYIGWFVGFVEEGGNVYFFAANIGSASPDTNGHKAKEITLSILHDFELLP